MGMTENTMDKGNLRVEEQEERQLIQQGHRDMQGYSVLSDLARDIQPPVR